MKWENHKEVADVPRWIKFLLLNDRDNPNIIPKNKERIIKILNWSGKKKFCKGVWIHMSIDPRMIDVGVIRRIGILAWIEGWGKNEGECG